MGGTIHHIEVSLNLFVELVKYGQGIGPAQTIVDNILRQPSCKSMFGLFPKYTKSVLEKAQELKLLIEEKKRFQPKSKL